MRPIGSSSPIDCGILLPDRPRRPAAVRNTDAFRDPIHVNRDGAIRLSLAVAAAIRPRLSGERRGPRWIDLVAIADQETSKYQELVEDLDQSRAAAQPIVVGQSSREVASW